MVNVFKVCNKDTWPILVDVVLMLSFLTLNTLSQYLTHESSVLIYNFKQAITC